MAAEELDEQVAEEGEGSGKKRQGRVMVFGIIGGAMLMEALVIFVLVKSFVGADPQSALGQQAGLDTSEGRKVVAPVEVEVVKLRTSNERAQRRLLYDITVFAVVAADKETECNELLDRRRETIRDRFTRIIRGAEPERFMEPDLSTLRAQFKHELAQLMEDEDAIQEILIPSIIPYPE